MKKPEDSRALAQELPSLMPDLSKAVDAIGTVHYSRFIALSDRTILFLADVDGKTETLHRRVSGTGWARVGRHLPTYRKPAASASGH